MPKWGEAEYERRARPVSDLDLPENARACLHRFFTFSPCGEVAKWVDPDSGSRWCDCHARQFHGLSPLALDDKGGDDAWT